MMFKKARPIGLGVYFTVEVLKKFSVLYVYKILCNEILQKWSCPRPDGMNLPPGVVATITTTVTALLCLG